MMIPGAIEISSFLFFSISIQLNWWVIHQSILVMNFAESSDEISELDKRDSDDARDKWSSIFVSDFVHTSHLSYRWNSAHSHRSTRSVASQCSDDIYRSVEQFSLYWQRAIWIWMDRVVHLNWTGTETNERMGERCSSASTSMHDGLLISRLTLDDAQKSYRSPYAPKPRRLTSATTTNDSDSFSMPPKFHRVVRKTRRDESEVSPCIK